MFVVDIDLEIFFKVILKFFIVVGMCIFFFERFRIFFGVKFLIRFFIVIKDVFLRFKF